jgi:hypothetical protein
MGHHGAAQCGVRHALLFRAHRSEDAHAFGVGLLAQAFHHRAARHLGHVLGRHVHEAGFAVRQLGGDRLAALGIADGTGGDHPVQHPVLAPGGRRVVDDGVGVDRVLLQAGQHRGLRQVELRQRLAEVDLRGGAVAVGALAQVDLVQVELQDAVLAQLAFQLPGNQRFLQLAFDGAPRAQEEGARHLLRDGAGAAADAAGGVRPGGARHPLEADAVVVVELVVLHRQHGVLQQLGRLRDGHEDAPLGAELRNLGAIGRQHLQVLARPVGGGLVQWGQIVPVPGGHEGQHQCR